MTDTNADSEKPKGPDKAARTDPRRRPPLNLTNGWLVAALVLWLLAAYAGTVAEALPRELIYTTREGQGIGYCREAVARGTLRTTSTAPLTPSSDGGYRKATSLMGVQSSWGA